MLLKTLNAAQTYSDIQVQVDAQKLLVKIDCLVTGLTLAQVNTLRSQIANGELYRITADLIKDGASTPVLKKVALQELFEFAQNKEGFFREYLTATTYTVIGYIDLSDDGSIPMDKNCYLSVELTECRASDVVSLYSKNSPDIARSMFNYDTQTVPAGQERFTINTIGKAYISFKKANVTEMTIQYANGRNERLTYTEIIAKLDDDNDIVSIPLNIGGAGELAAAYGSSNYGILDLRNAANEPNIVRIEVELSGSWKYTLISDNSL